MGRRTRKRLAAAEARRPPRPADAPGDPVSPPPGRVAGAPTSGRGRGRPAAPWAPFPLIELAILIALVLLVVGLLTHGPRGRVLLGCGLGLGAVASLELTIREHFTGYRSHSVLLAGAGAVAAAAAVYAFAGLARALPPAVAAAVFGLLFWLLRGAHRRARAGSGSAGG